MTLILSTFDHDFWILKASKIFWSNVYPPNALKCPDYWVDISGGCRSQGVNDASLNSPINFIKANNKASYVYWCYRQILRLADKKEVKPNMNLLGVDINLYGKPRKGKEDYKKK